MKAKQKNLQKLTVIDSKINKLLTQEQITMDDIKELNDYETAYLSTIVTGKINNLKGVEKEQFINKVEPILPTSTKNQLWESNHNQITWAIATLMQEFNRMPSKSEIATKTELSRQTIHKHMAEYASNPLYLQQVEQFRFMTSKVLAKVFRFAINGDIGAAKLYFNVMGCLGGQTNNNTSIKNQNNYIQINGTVIDQETIKNLNSEQLNTIETILKTVLPQVVKLGNEIINN
jgi:hypothetical protein